MFGTRRGNTIAEAAVVLIVLSFGIVETYGLLNGGGKLADTTESRIQAINLAREGIEAAENIRNTNWLKFSSDLDNCFDVANYNSACIGNGTHTKLYAYSGSILTQIGGAWYLTGGVSTASGVAFDANGLSVQGTGATLPRCGYSQSANCLSKFFRTVSVSQEDTGANRKMVVTSTVSWRDSAKATPHTVTLQEVLTNWKKNF
jgi:hypothetical protein